MQRIQCDMAAHAHQMACHLLEGTVCHLLEHCGDGRGRFSGCTHEFDIAAVLPSLMQYVHQHRLVLLPLTLLGPIVLGLAIVPELL